MFPFTSKSKAVEEQRVEEEQERAKLMDDYNAQGADFFTSRLRSKFEDHATKKVDDKYIPLVRELARLLTKLNQQNDLSVKLEFAVGFDARTQFQSKEPRTSDIKEFKDGLNLYVYLSFKVSSDLIKKHPYRTEQDFKSTPKFCIYEEGDDIRIGRLSESFIQFFESESLKSENAVAYVLDEFCKSIQGRISDHGSADAIFSIIEQELSDMGHQPVNKASQTPKPLAFK